MGPLYTLFQELFQGCIWEGTLPNFYSDWVSQQMGAMSSTKYKQKKSEIFTFSPCYWCLFLIQFLFHIGVIELSTVFVVVGGSGDASVAEDSSLLVCDGASMGPKDTP